MSKFKISTSSTPAREEREGSTRERKEIDYAALNEHIVAAAGNDKKRSLPGVISGIIDLGIQERPNIDAAWSEADAAKEGAEEFKDAKGARMLSIPQKPARQVALTVDFPTIVVDKGQFFGESKPLPLRLLLNGEFGVRVDGVWVPIVQRGYTLGDRPHDDARKLWGLDKKNILYRIADAASLLDENGMFEWKRVGELLGAVAQFEIRVYMKPGKEKSYFTEEIRLAGAVPEGVPIPTFDESILYGINLDEENDPAALKQLRKSVKNTIKRAKNYEGSVIQKELEALEERSQNARASEASGSSRGENKPSVAPATPKPAAKPAPKKSAAPPPPAKEANWEDEEEDALPF